MPSPYPVDPAQLDYLINDLTHLLSNARDFTASGREIPNPSRSMARMPLVTLEQIPGGGASRGAFAQSTLGQPGMRELFQPTVSEAQRELGRANIDRLLSKINLDLPNYGPFPEDLVRKQTMLEKASAAMPKGILTFLDLMTHSPDLNTGEQKELERRRSMPPTID